MQTAARTLAYFGKVPAHGDFVRGGAGGGGVRALDAWVQEGLYTARQRLGAGIAAAYARAGAFGFLVDDGASGPLVGVLHPSRDRVGRAYPLVIVAEVNGTVPSPDEVPTHYADLFARAGAVARAGAAGVYAPTELAARVAALGPPGARPPDGPSFDRFLHDTPVRAFWTYLWGHPDDTRKYLLFKNLLEIVPPLRGRLPERLPLVLRFPLGGAGPPRALAVRVWLEVVRQLLGGTAVQPSLFWSLDGEDGFLLLTLRPPQPELFTFLFSADTGSDTLCVLERPGAEPAALAALAIPAHYGRLLEDDRLALADFVRQL